MSQDVAITAGSAGHRDGTAHGKVSPGEIATAVVIGRTSEFFDFFVYGIASVLVFPRLLFPHIAPLEGTLLSFAIFSLAFIVRPVGSAIFMWVGRRHGRGVKMTIALFLLGSSTAAISFLPNYQSIGYAAAALLAIFRIGQGLGLAGAWDGLASLLSLNAPPGKRGWYAMMPQLGAPFGFLMASGLFAFFVGVLSDAEFLDWGWRYPFFCAFAINVVALFARLRLVLSEAYSQLLETRELAPVGVFRMLREEGRNVLIGAFAPLASFALFHLVTIFPLSYVTLFTDLSARDFLFIEMSGALVCVAAIVASGLIADRIGRRTLLGVCAVLIAGFAILTPFLLGGGVKSETAFILIGFALLGLTFGQSSGALTSNFSSRYRYTGAALTSDLAWLIGAAFAPLVALGVSSRFGLAFVGIYLFSGAVCTLASLAINRQLVRND
ncbi:MFS transporter [Hansschlegelia quercus]|uniref:MFS transporter n=1 Tax=Hansschlegelia quercus TaxID=2528245 RepID=A0A4Q9GIP7_9HYPH|nr:MFS transporter [Hansschlegelia quercus]TBN52464.1 MFS transporter [Hansschlegelia quercus]